MLRLGYNKKKGVLMNTFTYQESETHPDLSARLDRIAKLGTITKACAKHWHNIAKCDCP